MSSKWRLGGLNWSPGGFVGQWLQIRIILMKNRIQIRFKVKSLTRISIKVESWIRIRIKVMHQNVLHMLENRQKIHLFTGVPVYNVFPFSKVAKVSCC